MLLYNAENIVTLDTLMTFVNLCSLVRNLEFIITISQLKTVDNLGFYQTWRGAVFVSVFYYTDTDFYRLSCGLL